ncbi:hypothetical protein A2U01_0070178, partial [Trifolium medium]|nr:hypothetical protein [Trifolium medium]
MNTDQDLNVGNNNSGEAFQENPNNDSINQENPTLEQQIPPHVEDDQPTISENNINIEEYFSDSSFE